MRTLIASMAVALMMAGSAYAEDGAVSKDTLASFGLGGMQTMTDAQGTQIRGKFVKVWGVSFARVHGARFNASSRNGYLGSSHHVRNANGQSVAQARAQGHFSFNRTVTNMGHPGNFTRTISSNGTFQFLAIGTGSSQVHLH